MNRKFISSGAFAAVAAIVAASSFISCSSDDEYYENGNYTLANKRMTRSAETFVPVCSDTVYTNYGFDFTPVQPFTDDGKYMLPIFTNVNVDVMTYRVDRKIKIEMIGIAGNTDFIVKGIYFQSDGLNKLILCADATYCYINPDTYIAEYYSYKGVVPNTVFE